MSAPSFRWLVLVAASATASTASSAGCAGERGASVGLPPGPAGTAGSASGSGPAVRAPAGWCRGNTHVHTDRSGDSETPPEVVAAWYERAGFDFIVLTDHNFVTVLPWSGRLVVIPGVEITRNLRLPSEGPYAEMLPLHVNALFVEPARAGPLFTPADPAPADTRRSIYEASIAMARELGGIPALNHPTFHAAVDAPLLGHLVAAGLRHFEVANASIDIHNEGEAGGPSTEAMWDAVLGGGHTLFGLGSDDAHHYADADAVERTGKPAFRPERGWIMVRSAACTADALRAAIDAGDFYATHGPTLTAVDLSGGSLRLAAATPLLFRFIGPGGKVIEEKRGTAAETRVPAGGYLRAVVEDDAGRRAWVQPGR